MPIFPTKERNDRRQWVIVLSPYNVRTAGTRHGHMPAVYFGHDNNLNLGNWLVRKRRHLVILLQVTIVENDSVTSETEKSRNMKTPENQIIVDSNRDKEPFSLSTRQEKWPKFRTCAVTIDRARTNIFLKHPIPALEETK